MSCETYDNDAQQIKHITKTVTVEPTLSTSPAYSSGDALWTTPVELECFLNNGGRGVLKEVIVTDAAGEELEIYLHLFHSEPDAETANDAYAQSSSSAKSNGIGSVVVCSNRYLTTANYSQATIYNIYKEVWADADSKSIWVLGQAGAAAGGVFAADSLQFQFVFRLD